LNAAQWFLLLGFVWISPRTPHKAGLMIGLGFLVLSVLAKVAE